MPGVSKCLTRAARPGLIHARSVIESNLAGHGDSRTLTGVKRFACGSKELDSPPFPVSPSGGKPGAPPPPLRCGSGKAPAQGRTLIRVLDR
jgi:hypothetical protein